MTTDLKTLGTNPMNTMEYQYDALHRIRYAQSSTFDGAGFTPNNQYNTSYTYDGNGNIQNLIRNGNGGVLHNLSYQYADTEGPNRLSSVNNGAFGDYTYDKIGNLLTDSYDNIDVEWTVYGKVREVTTANGPDLVYLYDAGGNRLAKIRSDGEADFYIRDASGNVMSVYEKTLGAQYEAYAQKEVHLYGSSRLGIRKYDDRNIEINGPVADDFSAPTYMRTRGQKLFEFSNHLGNTLVTLTDQKLGTDASADGRSDYYAAVDVSTSDYYPFGLAMGARTVSSSAYRYGFNGKENDTEWGQRMIQDYGFRLYNPTIAKFLSVDPLAPEYPELTPYQFASNIPIRYIDRDGLELGEPPIYQKVYDSLFRNWEMHTTTKLLSSAGRSNMWKDAKKIPILSIGDAYEDAVVRSYELPLKQKAIRVPPNSTSSKRSVKPDGVTNSVGSVFYMKGGNVGRIHIEGINAKIIDAKFSAEPFKGKETSHNIQQARAYIDILAESKGITIQGKLYPNAKHSDYGLAVLEYVTPANGLFLDTEISTIIEYATSKNVIIRQRFTEVDADDTNRIRVASGLDLNAVVPKKTYSDLLKKQVSPSVRVPITSDKRPSVEINWNKFKKKA